MRLSSSGPGSIAQTSDKSAVTRQAISKHLRVLEDAGFVAGERRGRERIWRLRPQRLRECVEVVLAADGRSAHDIFGSPDDLKLRSCLALFRAVDGADGVFGRALSKYYHGEPDPATLALIAPAR